jgi:hypothetical protein
MKMLFDANWSAHRNYHLLSELWPALRQSSWSDWGSDTRPTPDSYEAGNFPRDNEVEELIRAPAPHSPLGLSLARGDTGRPPRFGFDRTSNRASPGECGQVPDGSTIHVSAKAERDYLIFAVVDHGVGLSDDELHRIGRRSFHTGRRPVRGSGLGLWVANAFVAASSGTLQVQSPGIGLGTKTSIRLPLAKNSAGEHLVD